MQVYNIIIPKNLKRKEIKPFYYFNKYTVRETRNKVERKQPLY